MGGEGGAYGLGKDSAKRKKGLRDGILGEEEGNGKLEIESS